MRLLHSQSKTKFPFLQTCPVDELEEADWDAGGGEGISFLCPVTWEQGGRK